MFFNVILVIIVHIGDTSIFFVMWLGRVDMQLRNIVNYRPLISSSRF